jgi:hypothetical protein
MPLSRQARRNLTGLIALLAGSAVIVLGDKLLGVHIELWLGLATFSTAWALDMFLVPFIAGFVVAVIFGLGGKWLCYFPPLIVRSVSYLVFAYFHDVPAGADLLTFPFWILFVILAVEAAAFGGVFGEIIIKRTYGRMPRELVYRRRSGNQQ